MQNKDEILRRCKDLVSDTLMETLCIEYTEVGDDFLKGKMPVNRRVHQPIGILHGGASLAFAESLGSMASVMFIDTDKEEISGIEVSASHIKSKKEGTIYGTATIIHKGRTIHLWEVKIVDESDNLICICKITNMIIQKK